MFLRRNKKGQAAIFIVLVFQVLFILFAMSLNVAMVVYDKINLQNSLDLAAYYGAKKQAEVLNAMAHINYQMRQNWKLLTWRYRILGTLAQYTGYHKSYPTNLYWCPQNSIEEIDCRASFSPPCQQSQNLFSNVDIYTGYCDRSYFTCISHDSWARGINNTGGQNICQTSGVNIERITRLPLVASFLPEAHIARDQVSNLIGNVGKSCPLEGGLNWLTVQLFLTHFRLDQKDRKVMIKEIYNKTLKEGKDLDNEDLFEGTKKVFFHNLTEANQNNVKNLPNYGLSEYHSFEGQDFDDFFGEMYVRPILNYLDVTGISGECKSLIIPHILIKPEKEGGSYESSDSDKIEAFIEDRFRSDMNGLASILQSEGAPLFKYNTGFIEDTNPLSSLTLSFYKKTDQTLYYGLAVDFEYKPEHQIFSLNLSSGIKFKSSAFAKAFGGSFGPQPEQSDPFIPAQNRGNSPETPLKFVTEGEVSLLSYIHQPNYSRWPGDRWGLVDKKLHDPKEFYSFLNKHNNYENTQRVYSISNYFHNILFGNIMDPLARTNESGAFPTKYRNFVRMMEWMAIYPDLYDINHYSILANYHQTYFPKICKLLLGGSDCAPDGPNKFSSSSVSDIINVYIRGDFGWPYSDEYITFNQREKGVDLSIAPYFLKEGGSTNSRIASNQLEVPTPPPSSPGRSYNPSTLVGNHSQVQGINIPNPRLTQGNLFYPWLAPGRDDPGDLPDGLLSSWFNPMPLDYKDYEFDNRSLTDHFLKCRHKALDGMPVSSSCVGLGRTGYSVKLISCDKVKSLNLKPDDIDSYCN